MSIDVHAKNVRLWKNEHEGRKGTWYSYAISASKKMQDGSYKNKSVKVVPLKSANVPNDVPNGVKCDLDGYISVDVYEGKDGEVNNLCIVATKIEFIDYEVSGEQYDGYEELDESIPF